jgi:16S rRNA (cytidine1402-2'-O)-methyltransferase
VTDAPGGTLFVVAVPIGNPGDLTPRALEVLRTVAVVAAEDTRHFATLARQHDIATRAVSYHEHNEEARSRELLERLRRGEDVAVVSDAGTPLVSDPGYRLVRAAIEAGVTVTSLPGASAVTTALAASGLPPYPFKFLGFLPRTSAARRSIFADLAGDTATLIAFEAPRRLTDTLRDALATFGERQACLARNLSKSHERYQRGMLSELIVQLEAEVQHAGEVRGEVTLLIAGASGETRVTEETEADARLLLHGGAPARAVQELLVQRHGLSKRDAYALVLRLRDEPAEGARGDPPHA